MLVEDGKHLVGKLLARIAGHAVAAPVAQRCNLEDGPDVAEAPEFNRSLSAPIELKHDQGRTLARNSICEPATVEFEVAGLGHGASGLTPRSSGASEPKRSEIVWHFFVLAALWLP
jgi:hypothetical protein